MDILKQFNLPKYLKGKSFSEASKCIADKFKDRNSPEDIATLNDLQGRLRNAQEYVKAQQEARTKPSSGTESFSPAEKMRGTEASASEQGGGNGYGYGGKMKNSYDGGGLLSSLFGKGGFEGSQVGAGLQKGASSGELAGSMGGIAGGAMSALNMANNAFGSTGIDTSGATKAPEVQSATEAGLGGVMKGVGAGAAFGPAGMIVGGVLGGASGLIGQGKAKRDAEKAERNYDLAQNFKAKDGYNIMETGGYMDPPPEGSSYNPNEEDDYYSNENKKNFTFLGMDPIDSYPIDVRAPFPKTSPMSVNTGDGLMGSEVKPFNTGYSKIVDMKKKTNNIDPKKNKKQRYSTDALKKFIDDAEFNLKDTEKYLSTGRRLEKPIDAKSSGIANIKTPYAVGPFSNKKHQTYKGNRLQNKGLSESATNDLKGMTGEDYIPRNTMSREEIINKGLKINSSKGSSFGEMLRYAPAAMNIGQLMSLKKPNKLSLDRLGNRYEKQFVDERGVQNSVQESVNNNRDAILSSSGGSGSASRAALLASQLQGSKAMSQAYQQASAENRNERKAEQQFNLNVDKANMGQSNRELDLNLEQDAAYRTNRSRLLSQIGNDLGGVGKEELFKKYPEMMGMGYGAKGEHLKSEAEKKKKRKMLQEELKKIKERKRKQKKNTIS